MWEKIFKKYFSSRENVHSQIELIFESFSLTICFLGTSIHTCIETQKGLEIKCKRMKEWREWNINFIDLDRYNW